MEATIKKPTMGQTTLNAAGRMVAPWQFTADGLTFTVEDISETDRASLTQAADKKAMGYENHREFYRLFFLKVINDWQGLRLKHLLLILDSRDTENWSKLYKYLHENMKAESLESIVPFSDETRRHLADLVSQEFHRSLHAITIKYGPEYERQREDELKNLFGFSAGNPGK
ncbi:MAG: hypothetical protein GY757_07835 [bacterium]|nr:hypothetical protein [bacterium]